MRETVLKLALRSLFKPILGPPVPVGFQRRWVSALSAVNLPSRAVDVSNALLGGVACEVLTPREPAQCTLLYLHGGAYILGSPGSQRSITSHIAEMARARVIVPSYRLAPEHPWPAGLDDVMKVLAEVRRRFGPCAIGGDSAGGGMALCVVQRARDEGLEAINAQILISPWVDLSNGHASHRTHAARDPLLRSAWSEQAAVAYINGQGPRDDPRWSPLFADQRALPRTLIHVGSEEILVDDAIALEAAMREAAVDVTLAVFEGLWHEFHMHAAVLPRARQAVQEIAMFLNDDTAPTDTNH